METSLLLRALPLLVLGIYGAAWDLRHREIPPEIFRAGLWISAINVLFESVVGGTGTALRNASFSLFTALCVFIPLTLTVLLYEGLRKKESLGGGDLKLIFLLSLGFSFTVNLWALFIALLSGAAAGLTVRRNESEKNADGTRSFPFGPFIASGWAAAAVFHFIGFF